MNTKLISSAVLFIVAFNLQSQVSLSLGSGALKGFGVPKSFFGFHGGVELPRNNDVTLYLRMGYYLPRSEDNKMQSNFTAIDQTASPYSLSVNYLSSTNYTTIEGGTRYYLGNDYDNGFSVYGGGNFMLFINSVKRKYDKLDVTGVYSWEGDYELPASEVAKRTILNLSIGLQGGVKYTIPARGTIYADITGSYKLLSKPYDPYILTELYSGLLFIFNVGFRKDLY